MLDANSHPILRDDSSVVALERSLINFAHFCLQVAYTIRYYACSEALFAAPNVLLGAGASAVRGACFGRRMGT